MQHPMLSVTTDFQRRRVTVAEAEADYFALVAQTAAHASPTHGQKRRAEKKLEKRRIEQLQRPFGFANQKWEALKAQMQEGDELWEFCTPRSSWDKLMGLAGYELVRGNGVVCEVITRRN